MIDMKKRRSGRRPGRGAVLPVMLAAALVTSGILNSAGVQSFTGWQDGYMGIRLYAQAAAIGQIKQSQGYQDDIDEAMEAKKSLEQKKQEQQKILDELEAMKDDLLGYVEELDMQLNQLTQELEALQADIDATQTDLEETRQKLEEARKTEAEQYENMKLKIQYMYENEGNMELLQILLGSKSLADALNQVEYVMQITEYDNTLLERYEAARKLVEETELSLTAKLEKLGAMQEEKEVQQQGVEILIADKSAELESYLAQIGVSEEMLFDYADQIQAQEMTIADLENKQEEWLAEQERLAREAEERRKQEEEERRKAEEATQNGNTGGNTTATGETSDASALSDIIWPLPGRTTVVSFFGPRKAPTAGASTYHKGIDIDGYTGDEIVAALSGTVVIARYSVSSGNYITIDHGNGVKTSYLHCSKLLVSVGDTVKQGEVIGLVGSTGISTGPHLHFSLILDGTNVDPLGYVSP